MSKVKINGKTYNVPEGARVDVVNNRVLVDGRPLPADDVKLVDVIIEGNVGSIRCDGSIRVQGTVTGNVNAGGSFKADKVEGNVECGGSISAGDISGSVKAGGSVKAVKIG